MLKSFARHWVEVTAVHCERLQGISEEQAIGEGIPINQELPVTINGSEGSAMWFGTGAIDLFARLWNSIHDDSPWDTNPFVFVYEFQRILSG